MSEALQTKVAEEDRLRADLYNFLVCCCPARRTNPADDDAALSGDEAHWVKLHTLEPSSVIH